MKKRLSTLLLASLVLVSVAAGCNDSNHQNDTQTKSEFQSGNKVIYHNGTCLYDISDPDHPVFVEQEKAADNDNFNIPKCVVLEYGKCVISGNEAIGYYLDNYDTLCHYDLTDVSKCKLTEVDYKDAMEKAVKAKLGADAESETIEQLKYSSPYMQDWCEGEDGNIYFWYVCPPETFQTYPEMNYLLGRMSKDCQSIEFIGEDVNACSFALGNGYIYYADNGYLYTGQNETAPDKDKAGIYKMKTDGSQKEKLVSVRPSDDAAMSYNSLSTVTGRVEIVGDNLYYIAQDGSKETYLYRLPLSGGTPEKVTDESVCDYFIDSASDTLYFWDGSLNSISPDGCALYSMPVSGGEKKPLFQKLSARTGLGLSVNGNYLYISDGDKFTGYNIRRSSDFSDIPCGQRYELSTGKFEYLDCYAEAKVSVDELCIQKIESVGAMTISWNEYKDRPENEKGVKVYA